MSFGFVLCEVILSIKFTQGLYNYRKEIIDCMSRRIEIGIYDTYNTSGHGTVLYHCKDS